jgi:hypothetical protein
MPTDGPLFVTFLLAVVVVVTLLQFLPALALAKSSLDVVRRRKFRSSGCQCVTKCL